MMMKTYILNVIWRISKHGDIEEVGVSTLHQWRFGTIWWLRWSAQQGTIFVQKLSLGQMAKKHQSRWPNLSCACMTFIAMLPPVIRPAISPSLDGRFLICTNSCCPILLEGIQSNKRLQHNDEEDEETNGSIQWWWWMMIKSFQVVIQAVSDDMHQVTQVAKDKFGIM